MKTSSTLNLFTKILPGDTNKTNMNFNENDHGQVKFPTTAEVFHAVFENTFYANCIGNGYGKTLEANKTACRIFGYTEEEMVRLTINDIFDATEATFREYLSRRQSTGKSKAVLTGIRKNGEHFPCEVSSVSYEDDNGELRTINTLTDISNKHVNPYNL